MRYESVQKRYGFENPFKPDPLAKKALRFCKGTRLLDVGCGEGADSVFFATKGFEVTAFDKNRLYLKRFRAYCKDQKITNITILERSAVTYRYPRSAYDMINCILVICCMKKSEFEELVHPLKRALKPGGIIVMSSRNYLDPELNDYLNTEKQIEPNTFRKTGDCSRFVYFIEKNRLRELFDNFAILHYYEGFAPCKYNEHPKHGDSYIICRRKK